MSACGTGAILELNGRETGTQEDYHRCPELVIEVVGRGGAVVH
jgi:hypothetical protein